MTKVLLSLTLLTACEPTQADRENLDKEIATESVKLEAQVNVRLIVDAITQYDFVKRAGGDKMEVCLHAGIVTEAYKNIRDESNYRKWKAIEKADCKRAGM